MKYSAFFFFLVQMFFSLSPFFSNHFKSALRKRKKGKKKKKKKRDKALLLTFSHLPEPNISVKGNHGMSKWKYYANYGDVKHTSIIGRPKNVVIS